MQGLLNKLLFPLSGRGNQTVEHYHRLINNGSRNLIIYSHGNATTLESIYLMMQNVAIYCNVDILLYEYPGYGSCSGITSAQSINFEINRVYDLAVNNYNYHPDNIILMGRSIGTGPTLYLASIIERCKTVILISPFTSTQNLISHHSPIWGFDWVVSWFIDDVYNNKECITKMNTNIQLVIIHGVKDKIIPIEMGQMLYDLFPGIKKDIHAIEDGTHNYKVWNVDLIKNYG